MPGYNSSRKNTTQSFKDVLGDMLNENKQLRKGLNESRVVANWEKVMGKPVSRITNKLYFKNGTLYVSLNSSVVRSELAMMKDKIIDNLNKTIGSDTVKDIIFR